MLPLLRILTILIRISLSLILIWFIPTLSFSQNASNISYCIESQSAEFSGGIEELKKFIRRNIHKSICISEEQRKRNFTAKIHIGTDGSIKYVSLISGIDEAIDPEVINVLYNLPKWKPAKQNGRTVEVDYSLTLSL